MFKIAISRMREISLEKSKRFHGKCGKSSKMVKRKKFEEIKKIGAL